MRLESTVKISIPDIREELKKIPLWANGKDQCRNQFLGCYYGELSRCISEAMRAAQGEVFFSDLETPKDRSGEDDPKRQYIMEFEVFDRAKPRGNSCNWHGQNTSQWVYAGAIVYQDGRVSTHH